MSGQLKHRTTLVQNDVPKLFEEYSQRVKKTVSSAPFLPFTADAGVEDNSYSLLSLTVHFWNSDELDHRSLGVLPKGRHNGDNMSQLLETCMRSFDLDIDKIDLLVRDAAASMKRTAVLSELQSIDCFAHKMQLSIYAGLKTIGKRTITELIEKVKKFVRKLRKSGIDRAEFMNLQKTMEDIIPLKWLTKGINVKWSYLHQMLSRLVENKAVSAFLLDHLDYPQITGTEFAMGMGTSHAFS